MHSVVGGEEAERDVVFLDDTHEIKAIDGSARCANQYLIGYEACRKRYGMGYVACY